MLCKYVSLRIEMCMYVRMNYIFELQAEYEGMSVC